MDTVITVEHLRKTYRRTVAVEDVSFSVGRGEIFGVLGPNGAGKTTTVECLQGLRSYDGGQLRVLGIDPGRDPDRLRTRIGSQLQSAALPERLRVDEAIKLFARVHAGSVDLPAVLEAWDLTGQRRQPFAALSGGQRQRLFLALALLGRPEVVFLDELTTGLDPTARRSTWELVRRVRDRGATVLLVTHFMEEAETLCDRLAVVDRGRVVAMDTPAALTAGQGGPVTMTFTANGYDPRQLTRIDGVDSVAVERGRVMVRGLGTATVPVAAALASQGLAPHDFRTNYPSLEDVFLSLTGHSMLEEEPS
ncbi:MAG: ABC transporter ATP-binding protein [Dactylosporangium sp.]|nr:ABC transporter ATP-binding protein [Dactylosporangium sp.]NNJ62041.1 ABC transporter ATP-binding protein [Dactylosporangium sp.]